MKPNKKKLLVATVGLAAINYVGCSSSNDPGSDDGSADASVTDAATQEDSMISSGNLVGPIPDDASVEDAAEEMISSGNLVPPPPEDAGDAGDGGN